MVAADYIIARLYPNVFSVAKFEGGEQPADVYQVDLREGRGKCTCPAWQLGRRRPCKHIEMVKERANDLINP